ncbi:uncharacterized protein [Rutidosis leptorrhynchoides]|uniref:uncharacterized protein n=1 Tax=Rutidosis leptorrhynchoides TaxID=125765 RepID=UPI003A9938BD
MANPRRNSYPNNDIPIYSTEINSTPSQLQTLESRFSRLKLFLKKPQSFPFLLTIFLILTWGFLRIQQNSQFLSNPNKRFNLYTDQDHEANIIRYPSKFPSPITKDARGWMLDPISIAFGSGIKGGALICTSIHVGEIKPGGLRGNHRHHTCNETLLIWGARTMFRLENNGNRKGYAQVTLSENDVAVAVSPAGTAHALVNLDSTKSTFIIGCQDKVITYDKSSSDFNVWDDLNS